MTVTVFTPTYNRASTLPRLYESLCHQTIKDFEWLVVDDGSTDTTPEFLEQLDSVTVGFEFRHIRQRNGGKHRAINNGVRHARGQLFFIVDSDDWLEPDAIEVLIKHLRTIDNLSGYAGIVANIKSHKGPEPTVYNNKEYFDATYIERMKAGKIGEKAEAYLTDVLRRYPFPEFEGEKFISEGVVWSKIAGDGLRVRWVNRAIYYFEYQTGGLTDKLRDNYRKNPRGYLTYVEQENRLHHRPWLQRMSQFGLCIKTLCENELPANEIRNLLKITKLEYNIAPAIHSLKTCLRRIL